MTIASGFARADIAFEEATGAGPFGGGESWGAAWGDFNSDPYPDLFVSNHRKPPQLFRNNGDGTFTDITTTVDVEGYWVANPDMDTHSATWADFDNDGDQDLMMPVGGYLTPVQFFINDNGQLLERSLQYGIQPQSSGRMGIWFDYDGDSLLDVLVTAKPDTVLLRNNGNTFVDVTAASGMDCDTSSYAFLTDLRPTGGTVDDGRMEVVCGWQSAFPVNAYELPAPLSGERFVDITSAVQADFPLPNVNKDDAVFDFNNDLIPDLYAALGGMRISDAKIVGSNGVEAFFKDTVSQSMTFDSTGVVSFSLSSSHVLGGPLGVFIGSLGANPTSMDFVLDPADPNVAGIMPYTSNDRGIYIGYNNGTWTIEHNTGVFATHMDISSDQAVSNLVFTGKTGSDNPRRPKLYLSSPTGYIESAATSGFDANLCITVAGGDFDNDGDVDLYLGCRGGVENLANRLYENQGDGTFVEVANAGGAAGVVGMKVADGAGTTDSVVVADYDVDGNLDLFVTNGLELFPEGSGGPYELFRNLGTADNHWVQLDLVGTASNRDAIGARVVAKTATLPDQLRERNGGYHRWSQNHNRLHFGLGDNATADLEVVWPSGKTEVYEGVRADALYRVTEDVGIERIHPTTPTTSEQLNMNPIYLLLLGD